MISEMRIWPSQSGTQFKTRDTAGSPGHGPLTSRGRPQTWRSLFFAPWTSAVSTSVTRFIQRVVNLV